MAWESRPSWDVLGTRYETTGRLNRSNRRERRCRVGEATRPSAYTRNYNTIIRNRTLFSLKYLVGLGLPLTTSCGSHNYNCFGKPCIIKTFVLAGQYSFLSFFLFLLKVVLHIAVSIVARLAPPPAVIFFFYSYMQPIAPAACL